MYIIEEIMNRPCDDLRVRRRELFQAATLVHKREQADVINSIFLIEGLERDNAAANLGMFKGEFIQKIGLTPDVYYGRAKVGRLFRFYPEALELLKAGETQVSILQMVYGKVSQANADVLFANIKGKSKREAEGFLSRIDLDGNISDQEATVTIPITLTLDQLALLDRAREVHSSG